MARLRYVSLRSLHERREPIEIRVPLRELQENWASNFSSASSGLPREESGRDGSVSHTQFGAGGKEFVWCDGVPKIAEAIRGFRAEKKQLPEITVGPSRKQP